MYSSLILIPFFSVIVLNLPFRTLMKKSAFWVCIALSLIQIFAVLFSPTGSLGNLTEMFFSFLRVDLWIDNLSRIMLLCIGIVLFTAAWVQKELSKDEERQFNFMNVLLLLLAGLNGIVLVRDIFSLYVFLEITAVSSFILIGFNKERDAFEAAFKYIILSVIATALMLTSIGLLLMIAGDTSFATISATLKTSPDKLLAMFAVAIFLCAAFIKGGVMPFHGWLPDAYSASPASVSVILAGVVTKTVGVYTLIRIVYSVFGYSPALTLILLIVGTLSVVLGALAALGQSDFKRMLAYSSISQVGYIVLGLATGSMLGLAGAVFHLFNHSIFKSLLFVNSAAVESSTGTRNMDNLAGLAKKMPVTGTTSILASLSCAGIPPLAGFWSKLLIIVALWMGKFYAFAIIAALASILTLAYFLSLQRRVFFGKLREDLAHIKESGFGFLLSMTILALITIGAGLGFPFILNSFLLPVKTISGG
ncbi:MAG: NADH-quinone oxidoreductase subunit L [Candidatus Omnitrophica bacterium]|nr:NADH-quinone oxidoreductase subunit L [Candidatus Omnitrophota bacterium]